jgi:hypothetical protein
MAAVVLVAATVVVAAVVETAVIVDAIAVKTGSHYFNSTQLIIGRVS